MKYTRQEHSNFLEEELQAQTKAFNQKLNTSATFLLQEREELFVAQFLTFKVVRPPLSRTILLKLINRYPSPLILLCRMRPTVPFKPKVVMNTVSFLRRYFFAPAGRAECSSG